VTAATALRQLADEHGLELRLGGPCPGGEVGAHYARAADGRRFVVKWTDDRSDLADVAHVVERVDRLRDVGYPAPDYLPPFLVEGGVVVLQREVAGAWRDDLPNDFPDTVLRLNHLQEGMADPGGDWTDYVRMTLTEGADGYCLHATLRNATRETRQLLEWVQSVGRDLGPLPEHDLVHIDFHHRQHAAAGAEARCRRRLGGLPSGRSRVRPRHVLLRNDPRRRRIRRRGAGVELGDAARGPASACGVRCAHGASAGGLDDPAPS
jgi:hypothetical protein